MSFVSAKLFFSGLGAGLLNGLLGAGGGILVVALLSRLGLAPREAHATSVAVILPLTLVSLAIYSLRGNLPLAAALPFVLPALAGSAAGAWLLRRISPKYLKLCFSLLILYSAWKTLLG